MDAWPPADINRVFEIRKANRGLFNGLKDILADVAQIIKEPQKSLPLLIKHKKAFATGGSILALLAASSEATISVLPKPRPLQPLLFNATEEAKENDDHFFIVTVQGTTVEAYQKFIQSLPDKGTGIQRHYDWPRRYQTYLARMTEKEAQAVNGNRVVDMIGANRVKLYRHGAKSKVSANPRWNRNEDGTRLIARDAPRVAEPPPWRLERRADSDLHLRMLSSHPENFLGSLQFTLADAQYDYLHEESLGRGTTVYVLDAGFDLQHKVTPSRIL